MKDYNPILLWRKLAELNLPVEIQFDLLARALVSYHNALMAAMKKLSRGNRAELLAQLERLENWRRTVIDISQLLGQEEE